MATVQRTPHSSLEEGEHSCFPGLVSRVTTKSQLI